MHDTAGDKSNPSGHLARPTIQKKRLGRRAMKTPKPTRGSVGPGTLDQELQEPQGLHQNQNTSKGPPDFQGNQKAKVAAAKGLLPPRDHRRTKSCRSHKGLLTEGPRAAGATRGSNSHRAPTGGLQRTRGPKAAVKDYYQPVGPEARCLRTPRARSRDRR